MKRLFTPLPESFLRGNFRLQELQSAPRFASKSSTLQKAIQRSSSNLLPCALRHAPLGKVGPSHLTLRRSRPRTSHATCASAQSHRLLCRTFCRGHTAPPNHADLCLLPAPHRYVTLRPLQAAHRLATLGLSLLSPPHRRLVLPTQPSLLNVRSLGGSSLPVSCLLAGFFKPWSYGTIETRRLPTLGLPVMGRESPESHTEP